MGAHDLYGKRVLAAAFGDDYVEHPELVCLDWRGKPAGRICIDGVVRQSVAVEIESRASKQVRGALLDLMLHPFKKKMMVVVPVHGNALTPIQCRAVLNRYCSDGDFVVVELKGNGHDARAHFAGDVGRVQSAVNELNLDE